MNTEQLRKAVKDSGGIIRLLPAWVPRAFCRPGMRIKLNPRDIYALGLARGGIDERWFSSTTRADNGAGTPDDEGLSYGVLGGKKLLLKEIVACGGAGVIGEALWKKYGGWPIYSKFFDNLGPLPHHVHHGDAHAARVGQKGKPEMYFFPAQMNNYGGEFPHTYFGLNPGTTKEQLEEVLRAFPKGDNQILALSRAYALEKDTGWDVPPGVLHAPGSLCTYEPQFASDVYAMYQSVLLGGHTVPEDLLWKDCPIEEKENYQYLVEVLDWEKNVDPDFHKNRMMRPIPICSTEESREQGFLEEWICYKSALVSAKRLTVYPGRKIVSRDAGPYGFIAVQGSGQVNGQPLHTPIMIRYGEETYDEYFVTCWAAEKGVVFENTTPEPLVLLKHFAQGPAIDKI